MYAGLLSSRTFNLSRSSSNVLDRGIVAATTRDSFEMSTLINLTVDVESSVAALNLAGDFVSDFRCLWLET